MNLLSTQGFPLEQLKILHGDLTQLEGFLATNLRYRDKYKDYREDIYAVQEIIERLIKEAKT